MFSYHSHSRAHPRPVYNKLVVTTLRYTPVVLEHHIPYKTLANGKLFVDPASHKPGSDVFQQQGPNPNSKTQNASKAYLVILSQHHSYAFATHRQRDASARSDGKRQTHPIYHQQSESRQALSQGMCPHHALHVVFPINNFLLEMLGIVV